jgi:chromosome segregation ATPase
MTERDRFDEIKDHVNVVFESLRGDMRLLAEGHGSLAGGLAEVRAGQVALREDVERLRVGQDGLRMGQDGLRADVTELRRGQDGLRGEMTQFRGKVREEFRAVRTALHSSHGAPDERVGRVERDVATLKRQIRALGPKRGRS